MATSDSAPGSSRPGDRLIALRMAHGLTQADLAERLGVRQQTISCWETGTRAPGARLRPRLAELLGEDPFTSAADPRQVLRVVPDPDDLHAVPPGASPDEAGFKRLLEARYSSGEPMPSQEMDWFRELGSTVYGVQFDSGRGAAPAHPSGSEAG